MDYTYLSLASGLLVVLLGAVVVAFLFGRKSTSSTTRSLNAPNTMSTATPSTEVFLNKKRQTVSLAEIQELSHDTKLFRFALPTPDTVLGLPVGKHFKLYCPNPTGVEPGKWNGRDDPEAGKSEIQRSYTPTSSDDDLGHFDLVVKVYRGGVIDRFPDGGKASQYLDSLTVGDTIDLAGPFGLVQYNGQGVLEHKRKPLALKRIGMIAGGTGITPMLQLINAVLKDAADTTRVSLLYANQTEDDILVREMLEKLQQAHPERFKLWYTLDRPNAEWEYSQGFVCQEMIEAHLPAPGDDCAVLMCGPPPMIKFACLPNLETIGHAKDKLISF